MSTNLMLEILPLSYKELISRRVEFIKKVSENKDFMSFAASWKDKDGKLTPLNAEQAFEALIVDMKRPVKSARAKTEHKPNILTSPCTKLLTGDLLQTIAGEFAESFKSKETTHKQRIGLSSEFITVELPAEINVKNAAGNEIKTKSLEIKVTFFTQPPAHDYIGACEIEKQEKARLKAAEKNAESNTIYSDIPAV